MSVPTTQPWAGPVTLGGVSGRRGWTPVLSGQGTVPMAGASPQNPLVSSDALGKHEHILEHQDGLQVASPLAQPCHRWHIHRQACPGGSWCQPSSGQRWMLSWGLQSLGAKQGFLTPLFLPLLPPSQPQPSPSHSPSLELAPFPPTAPQGHSAPTGVGVLEDGHTRHALLSRNALEMP